MTDSGDLAVPEDYRRLLDSLKARVQSARTQARRSVNTQLIALYWSIGQDILTRQEQDGWGSGVIGRLAQDLATEFPDMTGLSRSNLQYMRSRVACLRPKCPTGCGTFTVGPHPHDPGQEPRPR